MNTLLNNSTVSLSQIAHELSNPLTLIYGSIQLLTDKYPELSKDDLWIQLNDDIRYMNQLITALPNQSANTDLHIQAVSIRELFSELNACWKSYAKHHKRHLSFEIEDDTSDIHIECDPIKLKQCLMNLIKNSFEATTQDATIHIQAKFIDQALILTVSDTGSGISDEHMQHIFEPSASYKSGGKGLGLSITQEIIEAHHGSISAESTCNGTRFIIRLPVIQPV